jgi:hypothetical protein
MKTRDYGTGTRRDRQQRATNRRDERTRKRRRADAEPPALPTTAASDCSQGGDGEQWDRNNRARLREGGSRTHPANNGSPGDAYKHGAYPPSRCTVRRQYFLFIYSLPPLLKWGVAFYFYCNVRVTYYCRNTCKMTINSNHNIMFYCHFGRVVRVTYWDL